MENPDLTTGWFKYKPGCTLVSFRAASTCWPPRRVDKTASVAQWLSRAAGSVVGGLAWLGGKVADGMLWAVGADKPLKPGQDAGGDAARGVGVDGGWRVVCRPAKQRAGRCHLAGMAAGHGRAACGRHTCKLLPPTHLLVPYLTLRSPPHLALHPTC